LVTDLKEILGNTKYHHQCGGIPETGFMLVLLDHGSMTNERDQSSFYNLSIEFAHKIQYFDVGHLPRRGFRKHKIES
jgi:hypothetical protein